MKDESKKWAEVAATTKEKGNELQNLIEELKTDVVKKDTCLDHLQKKNDEISTLLSTAKTDAMTEFKVSKEYTNLLDANYAARFEDFRMEAIENFPEVDFSFIKLNLAVATSSLLQANSEDVNIEDDATTLPPKDDPKANTPLLKDETFIILVFFFFIPFLAFIWSLVFWTSLCNLSTFASSIVLGRGLKQSQYVLI